jgi:hypothetical protein
MFHLDILLHCFSFPLGLLGSFRFLPQTHMSMGAVPCKQAASPS